MNDPLKDFDPIIPVREDEELEEEEVADESDDDGEQFDEDDWFIYPKDLSYEDDSNDSDFEI